jgi:hypothetical protein
MLHRLRVPAQDVDMLCITSNHMFYSLSMNTCASFSS